MKLLRKCFATGILALSALSACLADSPSLENTPIANIVFEPREQPVETTTLLELLPVKRGQPYHAADGVPLSGSTPRAVPGYSG